MTRRPFLVLPLIAVSVAMTAPLAVAAQGADVKLNVSAAPEKPEIMLGEPTYVLFKVANPSERDLQIVVAGDYPNAPPDGFTVDIVGADGRKVPQPIPRFGACIAGLKKLPAKGELIFRLFLPQLAMFEKPGRYTLTIRRPITLTLNPKEGDIIDGTATTAITVVPTDAARLGRIIADLGDTMLARTTDTPGQAEQMLAAIQDERVIPYFIAMAEKPHYYCRAVACEPLGRFNNDRAFEALKKLTKTTADDVRASASSPVFAESYANEVHRTAAYALSVSPHPQAVPFLWTLANHRDFVVRGNVLRKAGEVKSPEALAIIQKLTADENENVRNEAIRYQKQLGG